MTSRLNEIEEKAAAMRARSDFSMNEAFGLWLDMPLTKLAISLIPSKEDSSDVLKMLLKSSFESGFRAGGGSMLTEVVSSLGIHGDGRGR